MKNFLIKNKLLLPAFLIALITLTGCTKQLNEQVYDRDMEANFYSNANQVIAAYGLPYGFLQKVMYDIHFTLSEFPTDEAAATVKANQGYDNGQWLHFHQHTWTSREPFIQYEWSDLYQGIGYCNQFLTAIATKDVSSYGLSISKGQMISEIKLMRALYYYWVMDEFGNAPVTTSLSTISPPTMQRAEVFAFIEKEIKDNIDSLGEKGTGDWYGHFTKTAAYALLATLYLNAQVYTGTPRWDDCITECDAIINSGKYSLDSTWNTPFLAHNENSTENIFVVAYDANLAGGFNAVQEQLPGAMKDKFNLVDYPWGKIVTQESFYNLFKPNDYRINQWIVGPQTYADSSAVLGWYDVDGKPLVIVPKIDMFVNPTAGYAQGVRNIKYEPERSIGGAKVQMQMNNDMVVFRLGEIMFIKAEAKMRKSNGSAPQEAVDLVNAVRARSFAAGDPDAKYTTASLTMDELLNERGREFAYEMKRREDLIRFNQFETAWWEKPADADKTKELYPIPFDVLTANPALKQNQGY